MLPFRIRMHCSLCDISNSLFDRLVIDKALHNDSPALSIAVRATDGLFFCLLIEYGLYEVHEICGGEVDADFGRAPGEQEDGDLGFGVLERGDGPVALLH